MESASPTPALDDSPIAALYRQHGPLIFAWLLKQAHSWEDAEDLLLEVFLAAFEQNRLLAVPEEKKVVRSMVLMLRTTFFFVVTFLG